MSNINLPDYKVVIDAGNAMTEIVVVDSRFNKIAVGQQRLELRLSAGLYLVKTRLGEVSRERFISVPEQLSLIDAPEEGSAAFASPALPGPNWLPEEKECESRLRSRIPAPAAGEGVVTVCVRDPSQPDTPSDEIALRNLNGPSVVRLGDSKANDDSMFVMEGAVAGLTVRVPAGGYILQSRARNINTVGMALWVGEGRETRVYLERRIISSPDKSGVADRRRTADISSAVVAIVKPGADIAKGEAVSFTRFSETAQALLSADRPAPSLGIPLDDPQTMREYPMAGILGAHLLAAQPDPEVSMLAKVVNNLTSVLPGHPDVAALRLFLGESDCPPIDCPPMLKASWAIIAKQAALNSNVIAPGSVAAWVGPHVTVERPWLVWNGVARRARAYDEEVDGERVRLAMNRLRKQASNPPVKTAQALPAMESVSPARPAKPAEPTKSAKPVSKLTNPLMEALRNLDSEDDDLLTQVSERLKLPRSTVANELLSMDIDEE